MDVDIYFSGHYHYCLAIGRPAVHKVHRWRVRKGLTDPVKPFAVGDGFLSHGGRNTPLRSPGRR